MDGPTAEQPTIQNEIDELERRLAQKKGELTQKKESGEIQELPQDKATLHEVVGEQINNVVPQAQTPISTDNLLPPAQAAPTPAANAPAYLSEDLKAKVQEFVNTAFTKSINDAISQAKATNNAALIDAFHDALVDELFDYLVQRGKLRKF